jgi:hypothetical protein
MKQILKRAVVFLSARGMSEGVVNAQYTWNGSVGDGGNTVPVMDDWSASL